MLLCVGNKPSFPQARRFKIWSPIPTPIVGPTAVTTGVPAGAYAVWGYTYEPAQNLWTPRDGIVRVIDGDASSAGPAVSIAWPLTEVTAGLHEGIRVTNAYLHWVRTPMMDASRRLVG